MRGFALNCTRGSQAMPRRVEGAKIALLDFNLQKHRLQLGVQVHRRWYPVAGTPSLALAVYFPRGTGGGRMMQREGEGG